MPLTIFGLLVAALTFVVLRLCRLLIKANERITALNADLIAISNKVDELEHGVDQATKMGIAAHKRNAVAIKRCDGITHKLLDLIKTNHLKTTKK